MYQALVVVVSQQQWSPTTFQKHSSSNPSVILQQEIPSGTNSVLASLPVKKITGGNKGEESIACNYFQGTNLKRSFLHFSCDCPQFSCRQGGTRCGLGLRCSPAAPSLCSVCGCWHHLRCRPCPPGADGSCALPAARLFLPHLSPGPLRPQVLRVAEECPGRSVTCTLGTTRHARPYQTGANSGRCAEPLPGSLGKTEHSGRGRAAPGSPRAGREPRVGRRGGVCGAGGAARLRRPANGSGGC